MTTEKLPDEGLSVLERVAGLSPEKRRRLSQLLEQQRLAEIRSSPWAASSECPLSFGQQRLWFLDRLEPGSSVFNITAALHLMGALDVEALRRGFEEVVRRHEVLRTAFLEVDGIPVARVVPEVKVELAVEREGQKGMLERFARAQAERPFDLTQGKLLRAGLLQTGPTDHYLVVTVHHIAFDAWSVPILFGEVFAAYEAYARGETPRLPELGIQYRDHARHSRERLAGEKLEAPMAYWRRQLFDLPHDLPIPADHPRLARLARSASEPKPRRESIAIPAELAESVKVLARTEGATFFMTLLAAFTLLLHRRGGETDIVVGSPIAGRSRGETRGLIGFFVNNLVLRVDHSGDPTFRELLARVKEVAREAYAREEVPFEKLVEALRPERALHRAPLFQVVVTLQPSPGFSTNGSLELRPVKVSTDGLRYDLELYLQESAAGLQAFCLYDGELFDSDTIGGLLESYGGVLEAAVRKPEKRLSEFSLLRSRDREILAEWTRTEREYPRDETLARLFARTVGRHPDRVALELGDARLTYRELDERSNRLARFLAAEGVSEEDAVGLAFERSVEMIVSMLAVTKSGACYVPLDATYPEERLRFMIEDSRLSLVLTEERLLPRLPSDRCAVRSLDRVRDQIDRKSSQPLESAASAESLAYVMYTSGSTGRPKGVEVPQRAVARLLMGSSYAALGPEETILQLAPFAFDASTFEIWGALLHGGRLVMYPEKHPEAIELERFLSEKAVTTLWLTGALFNAIVDERPRALASVRQVVAGGEALSVAHLRRAQESCPETRFVNGYGPTEGTTFTCCYPIPDLSEREWASIPIGAPIANTRVRVLDEKLNVAPPGVPGELYIGGDGLARGYRNRPELTAERFVPDPWPEKNDAGARLYRTGDRVRWLKDGTLEFLSRIDSQVKLRGFRVEPGEVEAALREIDVVSEAAVVVRETGAGDRRLVAYWVASDASVTGDAGELRLRLSRRLPDYMIPASFVRLDTLPLTPSGKLDRLALPVPIHEDDSARAGSGPRGPVEEALAEIFRGLLSREGEIRAHDDFFELGGHSLLATQVISRVRETFGVALPLRALFEAPTLAGLAERVELARRGKGADEEPALVRIPRSLDLPLSFSQQRLWFLEQLSPGSSAYNISGAVRFLGDLAVGTLGRSLNEIARRHESLRSRFVNREGRAVVIIEKEDSRPLPTVDLGRLDPEIAEAEAARLASESAVRPFALESGGLLRTILIRLGARDNVLLLTMHHIVSDGWSLGVLVRELGVLYRAFYAGEPSPLPEIPIQVVDHAAWSRERLSGERLESELRHWRERLRELPVLELPTDRPRPAIQTFGGARESALFPPSLGSALTDLARRENATLFMTLLAGFQALLSRLTGQEDVVVGAPIANRGRREVEGLIGYFANNLVLRADLSGNPSFREVLARVREECLAAYDHQDLPFEKLVDELAPERDLSQNPLFQVTFSLQTAPEEKLLLPGLTLGRLPLEARRARFDLEVNLWNRPEGLSAVVFYKTDLFDAATVRSFVSQYRGFLEAIVNDPGRLLSELPLLSERERDRLLADSRAHSLRESSSFPVSSIQERFEAVAATRPGSAAVTAPSGETLTYDELNRRANRCAHHLRRLGAGPETLVAIAVERTSDLVLAILSVLKSGAAYVPLDPDYPEERLQYLVEDARPGLVLADAASEAKLPFCSGRVVRIDDIPDSSEANPEAVSNHEHRAYVIYTSGSTGRPKGVEVTHGNVLRLFEETAPRFGFGPDDVFTLFHSFAFDFSVWEIWGALLFGGRLAIVPYWVSRNPDAFLELLREERVTVLNQTPSAFRQLARAEGSSHAAPLSSLRWVIFGGEALDLQSLKPWLERHGYERPRLVNMYGITETTVHVTYREIEARDLETPWRSVIGRPLADLELYVLDRTLEPVPPGVQGEIYVGGAGVARGYLNRPDLTAERFVPHPFAEAPGSRLYKSGDQARYRPDFDLEYRGRSDQQVKVRGFRIELGEIEACLGAHPSVSEVVVTARTRDGHVTLAAYAVPKAGSEVSAAEIRAHASDRLPDYMVPATVVLLDGLPMTAHGKTDRSRLPQLAQLAQSAEPEAEGSSAPAPSTEAERILARIWEEVLGVQGVRGGDNFFELGGDSILSIQVVSRANARGISLTPRQLFQYRTLSELAAAAGNGASARVEPELSGTVPLTPIQSRFFDADVEEAHHFNQSLLLELAIGMKAAPVFRSLLALTRHHGALRLRFVREGGERRQRIGAEDEAAVHRIDFGGLGRIDPAHRKAALEIACARAQASLDLDSGPIARFVFFDLGPREAPRLLWVLHHLVVDGVSWRILLEDFRRGLELALRGEAIDLGAGSASYAQWARALAEYARHPEVLAERSFWHRQARSGSNARISLELPGARENLERSVEHVRMTLDPEKTKAVLQDFPRRFRSRVQEVLLSALAEAMGGLTGRGELWVDVEAHGREEIAPDLDLSRTVGWFTSLYPLTLSLPPGGGPVDSLRAVKEALRSVPRNGIGYGLLRYVRGEGTDLGPDPEVSFNYLGQLDAAFGDSSLFRPAKELAGAARSPLGERKHVLDVGAVVAGGALQLDWMYSRDHYRRETIEGLARAFFRALERLIEASPSEESRARTESDFDLVTIDPARLSRILEKARPDSASSDIEDLHPLSPLQQGLLFHSLYAPESKDYLVQVAWTLEGDFDVPRFECAWNDVLSRHAILRTSFDWEDGREPLAVVHREVALPFTFVDLSHEPRAEERLEDFLLEDRVVPLSPAEAPLLRVALVRLGEGTHRFVWTFHHLLLDGWSLGRVLKEVFTIYEARGRGLSAKLEPPVAFRNYVAWLSKKDPRASEEFWRRELQGFTSATPLGLDDDYGETVDGSADASIVFPEKESDAIRAMAREQRVTLSTLFQGAWAFLLSRYSGEQDVVFGATVAGRPPELSGIESMVGLFINTIPVRVEVLDEEPIAEFLEKLQRKGAEAREFEHAPLVDIQGASGVPRGAPLFESLFVFENFPVERSARKIPGLRPFLKTAGFRFWTKTSYPLHFRVRPGREIVLDLTYDRSRFDRKTAELILGQFRTAIERAVADPTRAVGTLLPAEPVRARSGHAASWDAETSIPERFASVVSRYGDRPAIEADGSAWSYLDLDERASRVASSLARLLGAPSRVALLFGHGAPMVAGMLGALKAGHAFVPLDPRYPRERLLYILKDSGAGALVVDETHRVLARELASDSVPVLAFEELVASDSPVEAPSSFPDRNALAYLLYTSGSTGEPKGTMQSHQNVLHHVRSYGDSLRLGPEDRLTLLSSYAFDASVMSIWGALAHGASLHPFDLSSRSLGELGTLLSERALTVYHSTPTVFRYFLDALAKEESLASVRAVVLGGEEVTRRDVDRFRERFPKECVLLNGLGPTESTVSLQYFVDAATEVRGRRVPVGYPVSGMEVFLLDGEGKRAAVRGEVALRAAHLALGYWNRPELTEKAFLPDPEGGDRRVYRTGDLGRIQADGALQFLGRKDFQIKIRGQRVEPGEIEAALNGVSGIRESVVIGKSALEGEPRVVAYVVASDGLLDLDSLREHLRRTLPEFMVPSDFVVMKALPLTPTGKIDRRALPEPAPGASRSSERTAPRTPVEVEIAEIWRDVLRREDFGIHESFFDLGGHSLLATQVVMRIRESFDVDLPLRRLFERTTIERLAVSVLELLLEREPAEEVSDLLRASSE